MDDPTPISDDESLPGARRSKRPDGITIGNASYWNYQPPPAKPHINEDPPWTIQMIDAALDSSAEPFRAAFKSLPDGSSCNCLLGRVVIRATVIKSVGIEDIAKVEMQHCNLVCGSVSHCTRFLGGGEVSVTYSAKGELLELVASDVTLIITQDYRFIFKPLTGD